MSNETVQRKEKPESDAPREYFAANGNLLEQHTQLKGFVEHLP